MGIGWVQVRNPAGDVGLNFQAEEWYRPPTWPEEPDGQDKMLHFEIEVDDLDAAVALAVVAPAAGRHPTSRSIATRHGFGSCSIRPATPSACSSPANSGARSVDRATPISRS